MSIIFEAISAVATLGAAIAAAISAYISSKSARAANEAVNEAQLARKAELAPRLVLERDFLDFHLQWPHPATLNGEPVFLSRKHWKDKDLSPPTFSVTNYGGGPALELQVVFEFEDPNGELLVPKQLLPLGLTVEDEPATDAQQAFKILLYRGPDGRGSGLPLYQRVTADIASCAPGQTKSVDFPQGLLNRLFLRGLQYLERDGGMTSVEALILSVRITCHTVEGDRYSTQFRFRAFPFYHGEINPVVVHGHFWELPMYPKDNEPRVV